MNALTFLENPVAKALGWTLLHAVWQGFLFVLPVALVLHLLRNKSSVLRYRISVLTLVVQLLASVATFAWYYQPAVNAPLRPSANAVAQYAAQIHWKTIAQTIPWHQQLRYFLENHLSQFVFIYLIGVTLFGLRLVGGWLYLQQLSRSATKPATLFWNHLTEKLQAALAIRLAVDVRETTRIVVPMVVGVLKPVLLLPVGLATHLTTREIEVILAHELAHVKRYDYAVNLLQSVVEVLYFFHPALWWLSARVREEREHCCDDLAVAACGGDGRILAKALAHVEELRLAKTAQTPTLAMALVSSRQQLLHRVRRVLGVQTRPYVSNSSLAGITFATILLMSVSVYAMQQQDKPKTATSKTQHNTRKHSKGNGTEYGMVDDKKVDYVIWKGHKLSAKRVAGLQNKLDQVMAGKLSLDDVAQPDRDILLTIIETNVAFDESMNALSEGMAHIDYSNMVASAIENVNVEKAIEVATNVNYNQVVNTTLETLRPLTDSLAKLRAYHSRQLDSLGQLMVQQSKQMQNLHRQMEKMRFPLEELQRSTEVLHWQKEKLMEQRNTIIEQHHKLLQNSGKQKLNTADIEKQLNALQPEIKNLEGSLEELDKKLENLQMREENAQTPMQELEKAMEEVDRKMETLSEEMSKHSEDLEAFVAVGEGELHETGRTIRSARVPRPPKPPKAAVSISGRAVPAPHPSPRSFPNPPAAPAAPAKVSVTTSVDPVTPAAPVAAPAKIGKASVVTPAKAPKPAATPK